MKKMQKNHKVFAKIHENDSGTNNKVVSNDRKDK